MDVAARHGVADPLQMSVAATDGSRIITARYSSEHTSRALYFSTGAEERKAGARSRRGGSRMCRGAHRRALRPRGRDQLSAAGEIVVFGIRPDAPAPGFGYIRPGDALPGAGVAAAIGCSHSVT